MAEKCKETRNRSSAVAGENGSGFPMIGCADEYITSAAGMQEEIDRKFTPKRIRAEKVAELYDELGAVYDADADRLDGYAFSVDDSGEATGHHPVLDYLRFWGQKGEDRLWGWFRWETPERIFENCRWWLKRWYERHANAMQDCGSYLEFRLTPEEARLRHANFCRDKFCPLCNWRRSLKIYHQVSAIMGRLEDEVFLRRVGFDGGRLRYLFLTLTIRNVWGHELTEAVQALYDGWRVLYHDYIRGNRRSAEKRLKDTVVGSFRALEVTVSKGEYSSDWAGSFHPHLHVILAVKESYFERGHYLDTSEWADIWKHACGLSYNPTVYIEVVRPDVAPDASAPLASPASAPSEAGKEIAYAGAVAELSKYPLKDADFVGADEEYHKSRGQYLQWLLEALRGRRLIGMTGYFGKAARELRLDDMEDGDLVHVNPDEIRADVRYLLVRYHWCCGAYVRGQVMEIDPAQFIPDEDGAGEVEGDGWTPQPDDIAADVTPQGIKERKRRQVKGQTRIPNWAK